MTSTTAEPETSLSISTSRTITSACVRRARHRTSSAFAALLAIAALLPVPAAAADGCLVLLCLAAPSWQNIAQCVDPVRQVLRDLARGRPFPSCAISGAGNTSTNQESRVPGYCPVQYLRTFATENGSLSYCDYAGAVELNVDGVLWSRVWWSPTGDSVTEFTPAARARLGSWDTRFDDDYARWLATQVPPPVAPSYQ